MMAAIMGRRRKWHSIEIQHKKSEEKRLVKKHPSRSMSTHLGTLCTFEKELGFVTTNDYSTWNFMH